MAEQLTDLVPTRPNVTSEYVQTQSLCRHPAQQIKKGGNASAKYFACKACNMRWNRLPIPLQGKEPLETDILVVGPYAGMTYQQVVRQYPNYAYYAIQSTAEGFANEADKEQLSRFAAYCKMLQTQNQQAAQAAQPAPEAAQSMDVQQGFELIQSQPYGHPVPDSM